MRARLPTALGGLAAAFGLSGVAHLVVPRVFEPLIPSWLPGARRIVYASGLVELVCSRGLVLGRPWAGRASAVLLIGVWPGNVQMALDRGRRGGRARTVVRALLWARVALQVPLIALALTAKDRGVQSSR